MIALRENIPSDFVSRVSDMFAPGGLLSQAKNFEYREEQQRMAVAVAKALEDGAHQVVEAGTGVGKSLAYLVPSILFAVEHKRKALISTHTINLQEQLIYKDIPIVQKILPVEFEAALWKGRQNYLCATRLERAVQHSQELFTTDVYKRQILMSALGKHTGDQTQILFGASVDPRMAGRMCVTVISSAGIAAPAIIGATPVPQFVPHVVPAPVHAPTVHASVHTPIPEFAASLVDPELQPESSAEETPELIEAMHQAPEEEFFAAGLEEPAFEPALELEPEHAYAAAAEAEEPEAQVSLLDLAPQPPEPLMELPPLVRAPRSPRQPRILTTAADPTPALAGSRREERQETLQFEPVTRGRFEKSEPTIVDDQDLDVPTFLRRNMKVS